MINYKNYNLVIPSCTSNLIVLKSQNKYYVYVYNNRFYFIFNVNIHNFELQLNKSTLAVQRFSKNRSNLPLLNVSSFSQLNIINRISKKLTAVFKSWDSYYFIKIKFKGKVYKLTKYKKNNLKLSFGRCHKTILAVRSLFLRKKKKVKNKCMIYGSSLKHINLSKCLIVNTRPINMFTQRGLRLSRQIVYRKIGKKSSYTTK
jgi:ribosomal protein L6P/L9E